ncbi:TonB family protein [Mucilaginibacter sp. X5P1]|uniref:energy transducer TonB n=1 Tax=Mucilaginibacter sp. X5P1 TaxID=2723088 RepID=UPI001616E0C7|nr:energy transducer TonB [Mucilaginibacter sp. X5P1]MBB6139161.1 TonB family protein [Mucilaginibacter sp. X5P1]
MRPILITAFLFITSLCFAQRQNVYFLKNNGEYVKIRDSADYIRIVREPDSASVLYNVFEYYPNGHGKLIGKSSVIDPPKFEGTCIRYYANGGKQLVSNYKGGQLIGDEYEFYPNGKPYKAGKYTEDINHNTAIHNYQITAEYDSLGTALVTDGNGYYKGYDDKFKMIIEDGNLKNGKRDGEWKGKNSALNISYVETYDNGNLVSGISTGKNGDIVKYSKTRDVEPTYKGGLKAFYNYLGRNIHYPDYEKSHNIQGKVLVLFVVEKDGSLTDIKILEHVSENLDAEALRAIKESPNWIPGTRYGRPVRVQYTVPIGFTLN